MSYRLTRASSQRGDASATGLNYNGDYGICCWLKLNSGGTFQALVSVGQGHSDLNEDGINVTNTNNIKARSMVNGVLVTNGDGPVLTVGAWYFVAVTVTGTTMRLYVGRSPASVVLSVTGSTPSRASRTTATYFRWGAFTNDIGGFGNHLDGWIAGGRAWTGYTPTLADLRLEAARLDPQRTTNLFADWDDTGNEYVSNNDLTFPNGATTGEPDPVMVWQTPKVGTVATVASGNLTLTEPSGVAPGDLLVACIAIRSNVGFTNASFGTPVGSQLQGNTVATNGIASGQMFAMIRGDSAPTLVFSRTGGDVAHGVILAYPGAAALTGFLDVVSENTLAANSATATANSLTTAVVNEILVGMVAAGDTYNSSNLDAATDPSVSSGATDTTTAPTAGTWRERFDVSTATGADTGLMVADGVKGTAGATGGFTATVGGSARHVMIVAAFKLATVAGRSVAPTLVEATLAGVGGLSAALTVVWPVAGTLVGDGDLSASVVQMRPVTATLAGDGDLAASLVQVQPVAATLPGDGDLAATLVQLRTLAATLSGDGDLAATLVQLRTLAATFAGSGGLAATLVQLRPVEATLAGQGTLAATLAQLRELAATLAGTGGLSADVTQLRTLAATLAGAGGLSADVSTVHLITAMLEGQGALTADLINIHSVAATLGGVGTLDAALSTVALLTAHLQGSGSLAADLVALRLLAATLPGRGTLSATVTQEGALLVHEITATLPGSGALAVTVTHVHALEAALEGTGTLEAALTALRPLSATIGGVGALDATLTRVVPLAGILSGSGALAAELSTVRLVEAALAGRGELAAVLDTVALLSARLDGVGRLEAAVNDVVLLGPVVLPGLGTLSVVLSGGAAAGLSVVWLTARPRLAAQVGAEARLRAAVGARPRLLARLLARERITAEFGAMQTITTQED